MILRRSGEKVRLVQFANDWISYDRLETGGSGVTSPVGVMLDADEIATFRRLTDPRNVGFFWQEWELGDDGLFRRRGGVREKRRAVGREGDDGADAMF